MAQADTVSTPGRWALLLAITALLTALPTVAAALGAELRVGDSGSVPDPARFDDAYPDMKEWAAAGVRGGIPAQGGTEGHPDAQAGRRHPGGDRQGRPGGRRRAAFGGDVPGGAAADLAG